MENSVIDLIIRIKNGYLSGKESIVSPYSRFKEEVLKKLLELKFIKQYVISGDLKKTIMIKLLYKDGQPALTDIKIHSKPSRRIYVSYKTLKPVLNGLGFSILSSSFGILTDREVKKQKIGGELLFDIW